MILSVPATYYAGVSVVFYAWLIAAAPERWPPDRSGLWVGGAMFKLDDNVMVHGVAVLVLYFGLVFYYRLVIDELKEDT